MKYEEEDKETEEAKSRPVWGAWIEMAVPAVTDQGASVAPRMGRVD